MAAEALTGKPGLYRRAGDYRVVYTVDNGKLLIVVVPAGRRREIYRSP